MKLIYDKETDTLSLILNEEKITESDELREGIIIDYNDKGRIVSVEILDASKNTEDPMAISYELKEQTA